MNYRNILPLFGALTAPLLCQSFTTTTIAAGNRPDEITLGDVDNDGDLDIVVAVDTPVNGVNVWLNDGTGSFTLSNSITISPQTRSVLLCDFDNDGDLDLAVSTSSSVAVLRNVAGTFGNAAFYPVGTNPRGLTVADFDGNGSPDLAVANRDSNTVSVLLNSGTGSFGAANTIPVGTEPRNVIAADFDRDGDADLASSNHDSRDVTVLLNAGNGTFGFGATLPVGASFRAEWVTASDTDADGDLDLVVALGEVNGRVGVFANPGNGAFQGQQITFVNGNEPGFVLCVDVTGDRLPDLVTGNEDSNDVSVLANTGAGFGTPIVIPTGLHPDDMAAGDIDRDGDIDLVCSNRDSNSVSVLHNQTANAATGPTMVYTGAVTQGPVMRLELAAPTEAGKTYVAGLSFASGPGIMLPDSRVLPLGPSALLTVSLTIGNTIFPDPIGILDGSGTKNVRFVLPAGPSLSGINVYGAFLVLDAGRPNGIGEISSQLALTIQ
ncbi:MAG: VCBS repeat-containing protein [Planctomycetes bacterium]|nr:VCBS repeat-containing protein [Planctomycetota bacterium]